MAERLHRNAADPGIDTGEQARKEDTVREGHAALEERARQVGNTLGRTVVALREARDRLQGIAGQTREIAAERAATLKKQAEQTRARFGDMAGDVARSISSRGRQWREAATSATAELRHATSAKVTEVRSQARMKYYRVRLRGNQVVREYPLHLVFAAGVAGFLAGAGLRMWRSKHEE
ncbi:MAG TPA: hypothetical protein VEN79_12275 [Terriglobia bacterium]|nr:hypothetical protein [Terriglobia bacterium]